jgi:aspartyl-tRNA(Asn)/glutamyl-tRNA(Gln) amidotransferase subunit C
MLISQEEVAHVANLARLKLEPEIMERLTQEMNQILDYMEQLSEVNTDGVEPMAHVLALTNAFREDAVRESIPLEEALSNAPDQAKGSFQVPRVI